MFISGLTPFCSTSEVLAKYPSNSGWISSSSEDKTSAINAATTYLQDVYDCGIYSADGTYDQNTVDVRLKDCAAFLAVSHIEKSIFDRQDKTGGLIEKEVGAGPTKIRKKYQSGRSWIDPFPEVTAYISSYYPLKKSAGGISTVQILRG